MADLIDRQAAIDALCRGEGCGNICRMAIKRLPPAQPETCEDTVSRKAVIDTIDEWKEACVDSGHKETVSDIMLIRKDFIELPPVQPQRTGKWEVIIRHEHYPSGREYEVDRCPFCHRTDHNGDGEFCGYCGAKMTGWGEDNG